MPALLLGSPWPYLTFCKSGKSPNTGLCPVERLRSLQRSFSEVTVATGRTGKFAQVGSGSALAMSLHITLVCFMLACFSSVGSNGYMAVRTPNQPSEDFLSHDYETRSRLCSFIQWCFISRGSPRRDSCSCKALN